MDSADRSLRIEPANRPEPHTWLGGSQGERADRAAALQARIRELRCGSSGVFAEDATGAAPECKAPKSQASETTAQSTTAIEGADLHPATGSLPLAVPERGGLAAPHSPPKRPRWLEDFPPSPAPAILVHSEGQSPTGYSWRWAPSWLVSAVVHCIVLIACALFTFSQSTTRPGILIGSRTADPEIIPDMSPPFVLSDPSSDTDDFLLDADELTDIPPELGAPPTIPSPDAVAEASSFSASADALGAAMKLKRSGTGDGAAGGGGAQFYGIQAQGDRFAFIVDSSTSMRLKFAEALRELESAVRRLGQDQLFYVIFFDRDAERLRLGKWNHRRTQYSLKSRPESGFVSPTIENIEGLIQWMSTIQLEGDTNPHPAVKYTLQKLRPDAIFLLSDGEFTDGGETENYLLHNNFAEHPTEGRQPKTIVHCVGFYSQEGEVTLQRIAAANGGTYRFVEPPVGPAFLGFRRPAR